MSTYAYTLPAGTILMRCDSHRARERAFRLIPPRIGLWSVRRSTARGVYEVSAAEFELVRAIPGIGRFRAGPDLLRTWA